MKHFEVKENTHIVLKRDDVVKALNLDEAIAFGRILKKIEDYRESKGKKNRQSYYVINRDEPYAREIFEVIKKNETK